MLLIVPILFVSFVMAWVLLFSLLPFVSLVCGGALTNSPEGNFTSPGYNGVSNYSRNLNCEWTLSNPNQGNSSIYIHFENFYLESHQDCQFDVLEFRVGESNWIMIFYLSTVLFLCLEITQDEKNQMAIIYAHRVKKNVGQKSHNSVCAQLRNTCPMSSERDESVFIIRPCGSTDERFWFVFALLMRSGGPFNVTQDSRLLSSETGT